MKSWRFFSSKIGGQRRTIFILVISLVSYAIYTDYTPRNQLTEEFQDTYHLLHESVNNKNIPSTAFGDTYIIRNENVCTKNQYLKFVILVHSATTHFGRRQTIRRTWALSEQDNKPYEVVFLLGQPRSELDQSAIENENAKYGDIVQGRFLDTYYNLTLKAVLGLRWVSEFCNRSVNVVKLDDDVVLNVFRLPVMLRTFQEHDRKIVCIFRERGSPLAEINRSGKFRTVAFPGMKYYPFEFCTGFVVLMPTLVVLELFQVSKTTPFIWMDDVYVTGILPSKLGGINHQYLQEAAEHEEVATHCFYRDNPCTLLASCFKSTTSMEHAWNIIVNQDIELETQLAKQRPLTMSVTSKVYFQVNSLHTVTLVSVHLCLLIVYALHRS